MRAALIFPSYFCYTPNVLRTTNTRFSDFPGGKLLLSVTKTKWGAWLEQNEDGGHCSETVQQQRRKDFLPNDCSNKYRAGESGGSSKMSHEISGLSYSTANHLPPHLLYIHVAPLWAPAAPTSASSPYPFTLCPPKINPPLLPDCQVLSSEFVLHLENPSSCWVSSGVWLGNWA